MTTPCTHKTDSPCHEVRHEITGAHRAAFHIKRVLIGKKKIKATFAPDFLTAAYCPDCQTVVLTACPPGEVRVYCRTCDDVRFVSAEQDWDRHVYGPKSHLPRRRLRAPAVVRRRAKERSRMHRAKK